VATNAKPPIYWFAVKVSFTCPACKKVSNETMFLHSSTNEPNKISAAVNSQSLKCQHCNKVPVDGAQISVNVQPVTLDQAKQMGFKPALGQL